MAVRLRGAALSTTGKPEGGLRVTEQGEMIRFKYGLPEVTISSLSLYTSAILEANLLPPPEQKNPVPDYGRTV